ncbi:MAG: rhomboid family intramembrane serine protease [Planctomycetota bacterium]|mgnify:FL=1
MSWRDREYAQGNVFQRSEWSRGPRFLRGKSVVTLLIWANVAVFALCQLTLQPVRGRLGLSEGAIASPVFQWLALHSPSVLQGQAWRVVSAMFLHWSFNHILMNMLGLHFLGRSLERDWGSRMFLGVYVFAGLLGNVFYVLLTMIGWLDFGGIAAGASGCVLGLLGSAAVRYPHAEVWIYFLFPIKIRTAALVFGGWYFLNLYTRGDNAGGDACHLAGLLFGAWWAWRGERWWLQRRRVRRTAQFWDHVRPTQGQGQPDLRVHVEAPPVDSEAVDAVLKKVYEKGIHGLSETEKQFLRDATERQKKR